MLYKIILACALTVCPLLARFTVHIAPPPIVVETPGPPPEAAYVWTPGYYVWNGIAYVWVPGRWVRAPWPGARWVAPHWIHHHGGWVFVGGHWR
jgi:hypothetical protein